MHLSAATALVSLEDRITKAPAAVPGYLDLASMNQVEDQLLAFENLDEVVIEGLRPDRGEVLPAGYAILKGIMLSLNLDRIYFSTGALREGVLLQALK